MVRQKEILNSSEETKTGSCNNCGQKQRLATSCQWEEDDRTVDRPRDYRERGESRARVQHDVLVKSLKKVAKEAEGESAGWTFKLIIFVGGTCGSVHVQTFNNNLKELGVVESKRNAIRKGFVHELLNAQDTVLCSYFAQRAGTKNDGCCQKSNVEEIFQGLNRFE